MVRKHIQASFLQSHKERGNYKQPVHQSVCIGHLYLLALSCTCHNLGSNWSYFGNGCLQGEVKFSLLTSDIEGVTDIPLGSVVTSVTKGMCGCFCCSTVNQL